MTLILCLAQFGQTLLYITCSNGHDKVVQALLDHGVQVDILDEVSDISCIHVKLCNKTEIDEATLVTQEMYMYIYKLVSFDINYTIYNTFSSFIVNVFRCSIHIIRVTS